VLVTKTGGLPPMNGSPLFGFCAKRGKLLEVMIRPSRWQTDDWVQLIPIALSGCRRSSQPVGRTILTWPSGLCELSFSNCDNHKSYKHLRIHHHENEFARDRRHINGIESFWSYAKLHLARLRGVRWEHFYDHLKENRMALQSSP